MARHIGIILVIGVICAILAALLYPVFAQSKAAAKATSYRYEQRQRTIQAAEAAEAKPALASYVIPARAVIRKAQLTLMVADLDRAEASLKQIVSSAGGYVETASGYDLASTTPSLTVASRVPANRFDESLAAFEKLGQRTAKSISAEDVTEQIVDMDARMKTMRAQEEVYRGLLLHVKSMSDATQMQDKLMELREQIESVAAQRKSVSGQADMSSIEVTLEQKANGVVAANADPNWGGDAWNAAVSAATTTFKVLGTAGIWLAVFSPLWLLPCIGVVLIYRFKKREPKTLPV